MKKIIVNGTFDILHYGHVAMLNYAKSLGDHLLVCIDSDERIAELKGESRPIKLMTERKYLLESLKAVDQVQVFVSDQDLRDILAAYRPDVMVKGSDYKNQPIVGSELCPHIVFFDRIEQYSTTKTIENINNRK